jgi:hypothetical protein
VRATASFVAALLMPGLAWAHPHIWVSQTVTPIVSGGSYTGVEIEWRFDPESSEEEILAIDEDHDGKLSAEEVRLLAADTMPKLQKDGFLTWVNTGGKDFRPPRVEGFNARIADPATFTPPDWDRHAGDKDAPAEKHAAPKPQRARNLVYVMRFMLLQPVKAFSITTFDAEDFIRIEVDKPRVLAGCRLAKHPIYKAEFVPGYPVFADTVSCKIP